MWSRTQNYPVDNNHDDQISIINRFFDFINNTRRLNTRILEQNDSLAEMGYEIILSYINSSNTNNIASNQPTNNSIPSNRRNNSASNNNRRTRVRSRNNRSTVASRYNLNNRYTNLRNDWRNINRNNNISNNSTRNVRPRTVNTNNVDRNNIQSPLSNIIPMFGPLTFQSNNNSLEQLFQQALQPVTIRPTSEQIDRATEERIFNQINQPLNDVCPITRNNFNDTDNVLQILECRHCFTPVSLRTWFETSVRCPICRYDIREYNPMNVVNNPYRNNENEQGEGEGDDDTQTLDTQDDNATVDTTNSQDIARELVMNELNNINNDPSITDQQRNIANLISQSMTTPNTTEELIQAESSIDSNGNLSLTYQFGVNLPPSE